MHQYDAASCTRTNTVPIFAQLVGAFPAKPTVAGFAACPALWHTFCPFRGHSLVKG